MLHSFRFFTRFNALTLAGALALGAAACTSTVQIGDDEDPSSVGQAVNQGVGGGNGEGTAHQAVALLASQLYPGGEDSSSSVGSSGSSGSSSSGGGGLDPNTLFLRIAGGGLSCAAPQPSYGCDSWSVSIAVPPALQKPGILTLDDPGLNTVFFESGEDEDGVGFCPGGGGSYFEGTLEIQNINAQHVVFRLDGTSPFFFSGDDADGLYVAPRCP